jgi:hypothetical protein
LIKENAPTKNHSLFILQRGEYSNLDLAIAGFSNPLNLVYAKII